MLRTGGEMLFFEQGIQPERSGEPEARRKDSPRLRVGQGRFSCHAKPVNVAKFTAEKAE
jgi:hypothetical protein